MYQEVTGGVARSRVASSIRMLPALNTAHLSSVLNIFYSFKKVTRVPHILLRYFEKLPPLELLVRLLVRLSKFKNLLRTFANQAFEICIQ